jgi:hypothetical protein
MKPVKSGSYLSATFPPAGPSGAGNWLGIEKFRARKPEPGNYRAKGDGVAGMSRQLIRWISRLRVLDGPCAQATDASLLEQFLEEQCGSAFQVLLRRSRKRGQVRISGAIRTNAHHFVPFGAIRINTIHARGVWW